MIIDRVPSSSSILVLKQKSLGSLSALRSYLVWGLPCEGKECIIKLLFL